MIVGILAITASVLQERGVLDFGNKSPQSETSPVNTQSSAANSDYKKLINAIEQQKNDTQVKGLGTVIKVLTDDNEGSRHQRFLIDVGQSNTLLVAHNIDLAPRLENITKGDSVEFYGVYEWNNKGGVIHWTHRDPAGRHVGGWLKHKGKTYQ